MVVLCKLYYQIGNMSSIGNACMKIILGERLKELREESGLTQSEVAKQLGIHSVTYLHYEKDQREPPLALLADMAKFFKVSVDYLLGLTNM